MLSERDPGTSRTCTSNCHEVTPGSEALARLFNLSANARMAVLTSDAEKGLALAPCESRGAKTGGMGGALVALK